MQNNPFLVMDGAMAREQLRQTERAAPLHMRPEHDAESIKAWLRDRRGDLTKYEREKAEEALHKLEKMIASIKTRLHAKAGEIGPRSTLTIAK